MNIYIEIRSLDMAHEDGLVENEVKLSKYPIHWKMSGHAEGGDYSQGGPHKIITA